MDGKLKTFDAWEHSIRHNNVLSIGHVVDIVRHPDVPDRDLYVFDTENEELVEVVSNLGTLLYGLTVDSKGRVVLHRPMHEMMLTENQGQRSMVLSNWKTALFSIR